MLRTVTALLIAGATSVVCAGDPAPAPGAIQIKVEDIVWGKASPLLPPNTWAAVLEGDPKAEGLFTLRLRVPGGARLPPHWHPRHERVTVLEGAVGVGFGDRYDEAAMKVFPAGSYYVNPPRVHHFVGFPVDSIIQITAMGPWELHLVEEKK